MGPRGGRVVGECQPFNDRNGKRCNMEHEQIGIVEIVAAVVLGAGAGLRQGSVDAVRAGRAC